MQAAQTDNIRILGLLYIVLGIIGFVAGVFTLFVLIAVGALTRDGTAFSILAIIGIFAAAFMFLLSLPGVIGGWGLLRRAGWARLLVIVLGILQLGNVPIGTVLGVYTIWVLMLNEPTANAFN